MFLKYIYMWVKKEHQISTWILGFSFLILGIKILADYEKNDTRKYDYFDSIARDCMHIK